MNATDDITTEESSAVTLDHVTRTYKRDEFEVRALDDVTLDIPRKSFVAIMGPSGSGKTTLLNLVTELITRLPGAWRSGAKNFHHERTRNCRVESASYWIGISVL